MNLKIRGNRASPGRTGKKGSIQGATTRYLTRIIVYLEEVDKAGISEIGLNCFNSCSNRTIKDALQWLVSNKIIIKFHDYPKKSKTGTRICFYRLNDKFRRLRHEV